MELLFQNRPLRYLGQVFQTSRTQEQTAEVIVPDSCPDVERIVCCSASVLLRGSECRAGSATISGAIRASALCMPENASAPQPLDAYLPFTLRLDDAAITEALSLILRAWVRQVDARLVNSRKVLFRVDLALTAEGYAPQEQTIYTLSDAPMALALKKQTYPVLLPAERAEKSFVLSDELELPSSRPFVDALCGYETRVRVTDSRVVGSRAVFKGHVCLHVMYLSGDGGVNVWEEQLPFSQYCELSGDYSDAPISVTMLVTSAELTLDAAGEGRRLQLSLGLNAQCLVSERVMLELIEDAYAVGGTLMPQWQSYTFSCELDRQSLRDELRTQFAGNVATVLDCTAWPDLPYFEREGEKLRVKAPVNLKLLYLDTDGALQGASLRAEAGCETMLCENAKCTAEVTNCACLSQLSADGAEVRAELLFALRCSAEQTLRTLCGGELSFPEQADAERPSVILRACREGECVWDIAKQYATTCEAVCEANALSPDELSAGQLLLIPM